jgi:hypothetical protein
VIRHSKYNPSTLANDIALLVLDRPATIKPVALAGAGMKLRDGEGLLAAGWGDTDKMSYTDVVHLMWVLMPLLSIKECDDLAAAYIGRTPASHICAGEWQRQRLQAAVGLLSSLPTQRSVGGSMSAGWAALDTTLPVHAGTFPLLLQGGA